MKSLQLSIKKFSEERGWLKDVVPASYAKSIIIEAAELLEIFQWNNLSVEEISNNPSQLLSIKHELADVFIYGINLANLLKLDAEALIKEKLHHNALKYPKDLVKGDPQMYYRLKYEYRRWGLDL